MVLINAQLPNVHMILQVCTFGVFVHGCNFASSHEFDIFSSCTYLSRSPAAQVLLDYGEYNEQGDVSYTIANLEGSILFILGLEVPPQALVAYEHSTFAHNNAAFIMANRTSRGVSASRDIKSKYSSDGLSELVRQGTNSTSTTSDNANANSSHNNAIHTASTSTPAFTEMSFAVKSKDDHTDDDVQAMKQLGKCCVELCVCHMFLSFVLIS